MPDSTRKFNSVLEIDINSRSGYIHVPPYNHKTGHKVAKSQHVATEHGVYVFDWAADGKICGIEFLDGDNLNLLALGIK